MRRGSSGPPHAALRPAGETAVFGEHTSRLAGEGTPGRRRRRHVTVAIRASLFSRPAEKEKDPLVRARHPQGASPHRPCRVPPAVAPSAL